MRVVFLGSGAFAIPSLEALLREGHEVAAVVTQPDREKGRGRALAPPPVKPVALARALAVLQPPRVKAPDAVEALRVLRPELQVVVAYGQILPRVVIDLAPRGTVNVHGSLLPAWRGAAPVQWSIASGGSVAGVTTMMIDEGLDTGPILLARETAIGPEENAAELEARLAVLGAELLIETIRGLEDGSVQPRAQDATRATVARILEKEDGRVDWTRSAHAIHARMRGFHPWPGAFTTYEGRMLKLLRARVVASPESPAGAGTVLAVDRDGVVVACGEGSALRLLEVQPESRKAMAAGSFAGGARLTPGARLG